MGNPSTLPLDTSRNLTKSAMGGWALWLIAALFYAYEFIHRVVPSILTDELREAFSVNEHQLGLIGAMYFYAYAAFQLPAGILVDKYGAKRLLVIASTILTLGSFLFTTTSSSTIAQMSRFMIGTGSAFAFVGCLKIGGQWLAVSSFPLVVGLTNFFGTMGALGGGKPLASLVQAFGWQHVMMLVSFAGLFITVLMWLFLHDKPLSKQEQQKHDHLTLFTGLKTVMRCPQSWLIAFYGALLVAPIVALPEMWGVEYLKITYDISASSASSITHTIFIGTAIGGAFIGWAMTYIENRLRFMMFSTLGALVLLLLFLYSNNLAFSHLYLILFCYGALTANMLLAFTFITKLHPPFAQGAAIGFTNMVIMAFGGLMQHGIGWLLHALKRDYQLAFCLLPLCLGLAILLTFFIKQPSEGMRQENAA